MTAATQTLTADALGVPERSPWLRRLAGRRFLALAVVVAADFFLWGKPLGWAAALLGWTVLLVLALGAGRRPRSWAVRGVYALAAVQVGALALHPSALRLVLAGLAIAVAALADRHGWTTHLGAWVRRLASFCVQVPVQPLEDWLDAARHRGRPGRRPPAWFAPARWA